MELKLGLWEVERVLMRLAGISLEQSTALVARLRHLKRLGFPPGVNTGKGKHATYRAGELLLLGIVIELVQVGLTNEQAVRLLQDNRSVLLHAADAATAKPDGASDGVASLKEPRSQRLLEIDPAFLSGTSAVRAISDTDLLVRWRGDAGERVTRSIIIDLRALIAAIEEHVLFFNRSLDESLIGGFLAAGTTLDLSADIKAWVRQQEEADRGRSEA